jgi:hypothetical protein
MVLENGPLGKSRFKCWLISDSRHNMPGIFLDGNSIMEFGYGLDSKVCLALPKFRSESRNLSLSDEYEPIFNQHQSISADDEHIMH